MAGTPWIDERHFHLIVDSIPEGGTVLEWGSGHSTEAFRTRRPDARVLSYEHNPDWAKTTGAELLIPDPEFPQRTLGHYHDSPVGMYQYIHKPPITEADVLLIDGYARSACLLRCVVEKVRAVIWYHDSDEEAYAWMIAGLSKLGHLGIEVFEPTPDFHPKVRLSKLLVAGG